MKQNNNAQHRNGIDPLKKRGKILKKENKDIQEKDALEEVKSIIDESGNSFHCKVVNYFEQKGWHTLISPYYLDGSSNKSREIDLIAEKYWECYDKLGRVCGTINIKLFIECKYIPQTNVFWFSDKDKESTMDWLVTNTTMKKDIRYTEEHHYLASNPKVAKLFASKNKKNVENEVIYKALNQSLNSMVYLRNKGSVIPEKQNRNNTILKTIEMPVIVCNSFEKFHRVDISDSNIPKPIGNNFQLEVNYAYLDQEKKDRNEFFLIDIIDINKADDFLNQIDSDMKVIKMQY